jgi:hypothetical protein
MSALHQLQKYQQPQRAVSSPQPAVKRVRKAKSTPRQRQRQQQQEYRLIAAEASMKIAANVMICGVAIATLCQIIPNRVSQQQKLQEVQAEVKATQQRVSHLQGEFGRTFDVNEERQIAQEQTHFVDPNRTPVVWLNEKGRTTAQLPDR